MFTGVFQSVVTLVLAVAFYGQDVWLIRRYDPDRLREPHEAGAGLHLQ